MDGMDAIELQIRDGTGSQAFRGVAALVIVLGAERSGGDISGQIAWRCPSSAAILSLRHDTVAQAAFDIVRSAYVAAVIESLGAPGQDISMN